MKKSILMIALMILAVILAGCGTRNATSNETSAASVTASRDMVQPSMPELSITEQKAADTSNSYDMVATDDAGVVPPNPGEQAEAPIVEGVDRRVIKNAEVTLKVDELIIAARAIEGRVDAMGGMVTESNVSASSKDLTSGYLTLRVPSDKFTPLMTELAKMGEVESQRTYSQDVTEQYIDLEARVNNLKEQEQRLREILDKANNVDEILKVERELERVRGESESLTGKLNYLRNRVDYSTINIQLLETGQNVVVKTNGVTGLGKRSTSALIGSLNGLFNAFGNLVVFLFAALPVLAVLALLILIVWFIRKRLVRGGPQD
ncbi:MAG: DUF4349 domain-containing protein [Bacillota bacterium]